MHQHKGVRILSTVEKLVSQDADDTPIVMLHT